MAVRSVVDIAAGEEVCIAYIDVLQPLPRCPKSARGLPRSSVFGDIYVPPRLLIICLSACSWVIWDGQLCCSGSGLHVTGWAAATVAQ